MNSTPSDPAKPSSDAAWIHFGQSLSLRFIEPHFCHWRFGASLTPDDVRRATYELKQFSRTHPQPLIFCDLIHLKDMSPEVRSASREHSADIHVGGIAFVGGSFRMRVVVTLLIKAVRLMKREPPLPIVFVNSEDEAWSWLHQQAEAIHGRKARATPNS